MYKTFIFILSFFFQLANTQELPMGYKKYFEASLNQEKLTKQFHISKQTSTELKNGIWYTEEKKDTLPSLIPPAFLLVDNHVLGDFIANIKLNVSGQEIDSLSGTYIISGIRDSANYYFIQINNRGASFYKMYRGQITLIDSDSTFILEEKIWHNLRITRDILKRSILLETKKHSIEFYDPNLIMGYLGLGVNNYKLALKSLIIWAPTAINKPATIFN